MLITGDLAHANDGDLDLAHGAISNVFMVRRLI
jgi:hypothetical protein